MGNLIDGLKNEIKRCEQLLEIYKSIPQGAFAIIMIKRDIGRAEQALINGDIVEMIKCFKALQDCK